MERIKITIDQDGAVQLETVGFKGPACKKASAEIERALGKVTKDVPTTEMGSHEGSVRVSNQS